MALNELALASTGSVTSGLLYSVATASGAIGVPTMCSTSTTLSAWAAGIGSPVSQVMNIDEANRRTGYPPKFLDIFET